MQVGPREIARRLGDQAEAVCRYLLPGGKKVGNDWTAGGIGGGEGKSLKIALGGSKAGIGSDFADPESFSGDLLDLWKAVRGGSMREAIVEAKAYLGIEQAEAPKKSYRKLDVPKKIRTPDDRVRSYLYTERKISFKTQDLYRIAATAEGEIAFPFFSPANELVNVKYLGLERVDGKKKIRAEGGCAPSFWGWHAIEKIFPNSSEIVITEGEIDAMTWADAGIPALSVPSGSSSTAEAIAYDWDNLAQFETIYLCPDQDAAGQKMVVAFADRIGKARIRIIRLPFKDPNEAKQKGWGRAEFEKAMLSAKGLLDEKILTYPDAIDQVLAYKKNEEGEGRMGYAVPLLGEEIRIVRGHTYLVGGQQGHGKTLLANQLSIECAERGEVIAIASMEVETIELMSQVIDLQTEKAEQSEDEIEGFMTRFGERFVFLKEHGRVPLFAVMEFFEYARSRYGATHFVLDNLTKLRTKIDDYAQQSEDINAVTDYARDKKVTIWIVAHLKKKGEKKHEYDNDDVRGSGVIADLASTVLQVVRNKKKEQTTDPVGDEPDTWIRCTKQRVSGKEPVIGLFKIRSDVVKLERRKERKIEDDDIPPSRPEEQTSFSAPYKDE